MTVDIILITLALLALLCIVFEELLRFNKAKTTLLLGTLSWVILFIGADGPEARAQRQHMLDENLLEIASLWLFLMATMTFVAYLNARGMVEALVHKLFPQHLTQKQLMLATAVFGLTLSAICDNVTATLVSLGLVQAFEMDHKTRLKMATLVVFAVNSGGVALITGDVTTLMIFLDGHVSMGQLLALLLPSTVSVLFLGLLFCHGLKGSVDSVSVEHHFNWLDFTIAGIFFSTLMATMALNFFFQIPPVLTFLLGLSVMFLVGGTIHSDEQEVKILDYVRRIEFDTLLFFLGILLIVGIQKEIGTLELVTDLYSQYDPHIANFFAGMGSALLDNVPLTAALLKAQPVMTTPQWLTLTYAVGVGGSLLAIGSAAGIIAMSKIPGLTFGSYLRHFPALLAAYGVGYGCTLILAEFTIR